MNDVQLSFGFGQINPPTLDEVKTFFTAKAVPVAEAEVFYYYYQSLDWHSESGMPIHNWKEAAEDWLYNLEN
ncbi:hypothetical protein DN752_04475 [Echinicola strongylocentroti]|uniref:Uncharacterized protein n=1 Tax=Echinicola strongylocentroti TaxID=1795355 RepID=A0A2Z4IR52_9BACT|nr:hypothetical protein [Echinicola strongylocentroti]AWW33046.1 hypothetical protein DN752_04475 [Echinicola strongylocentroti]